jgi:hypothetical protein
VVYRRPSSVILEGRTPAGFFLFQCSSTSQNKLPHEKRFALQSAPRSPGAKRSATKGRSCKTALLLIYRFKLVWADIRIRWLASCQDVILITTSTENILALLISERDKLNRAIEELGDPEARTTPPTDDGAEPVARSKRRTFTPAQRRRQSEKIKAYWAAKRKAAKVVAAPVARKRSPMTAAQKKTLSLKMKAAWAKRKKTAA